jgi:Flp pilus assembly protein TadG
MRRAAIRLWRSDRGAVAPIVAISLLGLIAAGGLAFDYARLASLDTELQSAADQAALAAATQLDGKSGAQTRATAAAQNLITNRALFANDGANRNVTVPTVLFYQTKTKVAATGDADSRFVEVIVGTKRAFYALTPVVAAFSSAPISAKAFAGLGTAICKVPPVMICNPQETSTNKTFDATGLSGRGLNLVSVGGGSGNWAPGNFGYLNTGGGSSGAPGLREALGWVSPPGDCVSQSGVNTKPGATVTVTDAFNTRFDIYDSGPSCPTGGACPPASNTRKDLVQKNGNGNGVCSLGNNGWQEASNPYLPTSATTPLTAAAMPANMGYPRDMCHAISANGSCTDGRIGDGAWDRNAFFYVNYGSGFAWQSAMTAAGYTPGSVTRYQVYQWEMTNGLSNIAAPKAIDANLTAHATPVCYAGSPAGGVVPGPSSVDRRRISTAVVNCTENSVNGSSVNVPVVKWIDLFLVEPSVARARTSSGDIYAEIIDETGTGAAGVTVAQVVRRDVPYLIE